MNLLRPLALEKASTAGLQMVPTKKFFKPVLVVNAPVDADTASIVHCEYLWGKSGTPIEFEGHHRPKGELAGAIVKLESSAMHLELKSEKVAHFSFWREEKKGMRIDCRIHLPETEPDRLLELLTFLAELNKSEYTVTITDPQGSLLEVVAGSGREDPGYQFAEPDAEGFYEKKRATQRPFAEDKIKACVITLDVKDGYICGWYVVVTFPKGQILQQGRDLVVTNPIFATKAEALERAASEALAYLTSDGVQAAMQAKKDQKSVAAAKDFLFDIFPAMRPAEATEVKD